jgi:hypothetical protein
LDPLADPVLARLSRRLDALIDNWWFREHPNAKVRERPASPLEVALGLAPGSTVRVRRLPDGSQVREFYDP